MKDLTDFAGVNSSTVYYHLENLIKEGRVRKVRRGRYELIRDAQDSSEDEGEDFRKPCKSSEKSLKFHEKLIGEWEGKLKLHPLEKIILLEILTKKNWYEKLTATQIARKCEVSVNTVIKYCKFLKLKGLIEMNKVGRQWVFIPTEAAIKGFTEFFKNSKKRAKSDITYSKKCKSNSSIPDNNIDDQFDDDTAFEQYLEWQLKNQHRIIWRIKLIRCSHETLERAGWIFGQKHIRKHLRHLAYIYKAKDPKAEYLYVLPKEPFIFTSKFEYIDQLESFINNLVKALKEYEIAIDLTHPVEILLEHSALEDNVFARKAVSKGLLYLKSKVITKDANGNPIEYAIIIDKSKGIHLEFEGREAEHFSMKCEEFIDFIVSGKLDPAQLAALPEKAEKIEREISTMSSNIQQFSEVTDRFTSAANVYSENILTHIGSIGELGTSVNKLTEVVTKLTNAVSPELEEPEEIKDVSIVYSRGRAKIPTRIFLNSNLRYRKSNKVTKSFAFEHEPKEGIYFLVPTGDQVRKTREIILPKRLRKVRRGTKIVWWLTKKIICFKILSRGEKGE